MIINRTQETNGVARVIQIVDAPVTSKAVHKATLMKEDFVRLSFDSDVDYKFKAGDWVTLENGGMPYVLADDYFPTMKDEGTFSYELKFNAPWYNLDKVMFLFNTYENGVVVKRESDWYITDTAANILNLLVRATRDRSNSPCPIDFVFCEPTISKTFTFSSTSILGALNMLAKEFELEWWFTYENGFTYLHFGECDNSVYSVDGEVQFIDGVRVKDQSKITELVVGENVTKPSVSQKEGLRRFYYVFGSSRNIDQSVDVEQAENGFITSIVTKRLALEGNPQDMVEGSGEEVVIFDDIYKRSDYRVTGVRPIEIQTEEYIGDDAEGNPMYKTYNVYNLQIKDFSDYVFSLIQNDPEVQNIEDIVASGKPLSLKFITKDFEGQTITPKLAGFEFEVHATLVTDDETGESWYEFQIQHQEINGYIIPNNVLIPQIGDFVCIYNVKGKYIDGSNSNNAQLELREAFNKWYANKKRDISYTIKPYANESIDLNIGDAVRLYYTDNIIVSRINSFEKHIDEKIDASYTISSYAKMGSVNQLKEDVKILAASISNGTATGVDLNALNAYLRRIYLSKVNDDTASGRISFLRGLSVGEYLEGGFLGNGAAIDSEGKGEFEEITVRGAIRAAELVFNQISAEEGESIRSIGHGEILSVEVLDNSRGIATLKLEGDEWPTIDTRDICRGLYNTIDKAYDNSDIVEGEDDNGFRTKKGFFASYFTITRINRKEKGFCEFRYELQSGTKEHPCSLMKFAVYGNFDNTKRERQSSMYITAVGIAPRLLFLAGVNDWKIKPQNIKLALGNINGIQVYERLVDGSVALKTLDGDAGLFVEDNIFLGGIINQFTSADWEYIQNQLGQGIHAQLIRGSDNIVVDALGNIVGGIYVEDTDGGSVVRRYKLHTGIIVYDSAKKKYLSLGSGELADDEFSIQFVTDGCDAVQDGADFFITNIHNTNDGISGTTLSDSELAVMRETNQCAIHFIVRTANGWETQFSYPVKITHLDYAYVSFDLTNEYDSISYRSQTKRYVGLPVSTQIKAFANGAEADIVEVSVESDLFTGILTFTSEDTTPKQKRFGSLVATLNGDTLTIDHLSGGNETDMPDKKHWFDISSVAKYAGIRYESGVKRFTLNEVTDTTLYKLIISANAILKEGNSYTPSSIDVQVQVIDNSGMEIKTAAWLEANSPVKVRYVKGVYSPNSTLLTTCPAFSDPTVVDCITVVLVDTTDNENVILDIESVTINSKGLDGAGQAYVWTSAEELVVDCDENGAVAENTSYQLDIAAYWGDHKLMIIDYTIEYDGVVDSVSNIQSGVFELHKTYSWSKDAILTTKYIDIEINGKDTTSNEYHVVKKSIPVVVNKQGRTGVAGAAGAAVVFLGQWSDLRGYTWNDDIRNAVKHNGFYWFVDVRCENSYNLGEPSLNNDNWRRVTSVEFVATQVLLAENAEINLLSSNIINLFDGVGNKTASINSDGKGSYCIYYTDGKKMMEFSSKGFIYYYNDDDENSVQWRLGHGGNINDSSSSDWKPIWLYKFSGGLQSVTFSPTQTFNRGKKWQFFDGSDGDFSKWDEKIYELKPLNNNPSDNGYVADGYYTTDEAPWNKINEDGDSTLYGIIVLHITNGSIVGKYVRVRQADGSFTTEVIFENG